MINRQAVKMTIYTSQSLISLTASHYTQMSVLYFLFCLYISLIQVCMSFTCSLIETNFSLSPSCLLHYRDILPERSLNK